MKIQLCISDFECGGGAQKQMFFLAENLAKKHQIMVMVMLQGEYNEDKWCYINTLKGKGIPVCFLADSKSPSMKKIFKGALETTKKYKPDVVVSFMFHSILLMRTVRMFNKFPILIDSYRNASDPKKFRIILTRFTDFLSNAMVYNSFDHGLRLSKKNHTIFNAIDLNYYDCLKCGGGNTFRWLCVSRLAAHKNILTLLQATQILKKNNKEFELYIYGDGPLREELQDYINSNNLSDFVFLCGVSKNIFKHYSEADAFVQISSWEGLSNSMIEAAASKLPMVLTPVSGVKDLFDDCINEYLVTIGSAEDAARVMTKIMGMNASEREAFGALLRDKVKEKCDLPNVIDKWEALFNEVDRGFIV